jgi:hypothetical protein
VRLPLQLRVTVLLFILVTAVNLATPRGAGPDEPSHVVRAAGLARGDVRGTATSDPHLRVFDVPGWAGQPDPGCYAFQPDQGASCASVTDSSNPTSTAWSYPLLGHVAPAIGTLLPGDARTMWASRAMHTLACVVLVGAALAQLIRRGRRVSAAALLLAMTPTAIFSMAVVNPSGMAIAGAIGMWVFGADLLRAAGAGVPADRATTWWLVASWCSAVLPRDDGLLWVASIAITLLVTNRVGVSDAVTALGVGASTVIAASTLAAAAWFVFAGTDLVPLPVDASGHELARLIVDRTGAHLYEAVGQLGWLDTPIPTLAFIAWWVGAAVLAGANLAHGHVRAAAIPVAVLAATLAISWIVEYIQAPDAGLFWQGRYSLPLFVGVVLAVDNDRLDRPSSVAVERGVAGLAVCCWLLGMAQMQRRFGVGINGTWAPWRWDTWSNPVPSWVLLIVFVVAAVAITWTIDRESAAGYVAEAQSTK